MNRTQITLFLVLAFVIALPINLLAQKNDKNRSQDEHIYQITDEVVVPHTPVKNQAQSGT